jgi:uncharacterized membrane protein
MATENSVLMDHAKESLKGKWSLAVKATLILFLISLLAGVIPFLGFVARMIITGPLLVGTTIFYLAIARNQDAQLSQLFKGFDDWTRYFVAYILLGLYVLLWFLLFIIPGIIYSLAYSQTFFILAEDDAITPKEAIKKSRVMMQGYKWKLFKLQLRFVGWALLCVLTLFVGFLWLVPYVQTTLAKFYDDIKQKEADIPHTTETPEVIPVVAEVI